ncbi:hypothetical protein ABIA35_007162 [Catenulispora sp. MAP12-49]|uniref:hypothetical protein n=1 Tax=Catenulispora sp. MAP12-49 TaxID=3156302 RepID=UPI0035167162
MGRTVHPIELVQTEGAIHFAFLVDDEGYAGPESTERGIVYHRANLAVEVQFFDYCGRDLCVGTSLVAYDTEPEPERLRRTIHLEQAYAAHGLGPPQDVPGSAQTLRAASKSLASQAQALRRLIAFLKQQDPGRAQASAPDRPPSWFQS